MSALLIFEQFRVEQTAHWDAFVALMREYASSDLNNPGLSSIHGDMLHPQDCRTDLVVCRGLRLRVG